MKILVTGGTGYIGSHTVVELQQKGFEVVIVDNLSNSEANVVDLDRFDIRTRPHFEFDLVDQAKNSKFFHPPQRFEGRNPFCSLQSCWRVGG